MLALPGLINIVLAGICVSKYLQRRRRVKLLSRSIVIMERYKISSQADTHKNFPLKYEASNLFTGKNKEINLPQSSFETGDEVTRRELRCYS